MITSHEALRAHTMGSAYAGFAEKNTGSIEPGKFADMVVWNHDLYTMKPIELNELKSLMTIVNGNVVFEAQRGPGSKTGAQ
jgi:predicted amidohydrolase YtcJ